jgi:LysM repeat protein
VFALAAAPGAFAQAPLADLREDVSGLTQRVNELTLRVEQLERQNQDLQARAAALGDGRGSVTPEQLNRAIADLNASIKTAVSSSREEILQQVASQMENLAKQTNAALDSMAKPAASPVRAPEAPAAARTAQAEPAQRDGISYTVAKGDSIGIIARKTGVRSQEIVDANKLADPSRIQAGQVLFIPGGKLRDPGTP